MSAVRKIILRHPCPSHLLAHRRAITSPRASGLCNRILDNWLITNGSSWKGQITSNTTTASHPLRSFHSSVRKLTKADAHEASEPVRLAKLIATNSLNMQMSRRSAEGLIESGEVTVAGDIITDPGYKISAAKVMGGGGIVKVAGRRLILPNHSSKLSKNTGQSNVNAMARTRVWLVNKLPGELVSEHDPEGRPSLLERMYRSGVGKPSRRVKKKGQGQVTPLHLKPVGRLDMMTEGLMLLTNDGRYARDMELPQNAFHRTYRARVHGRMTPGKLKAVRNGVDIEGTFYKGMRVNLELNKGNRVKGGNTNSWIRVTCVEGKNRQVRRVLDHVGLKVTRLIRTSFGDYDLNTIPTGLAIEVPVKPLDDHRRKGTFKKIGQNRRRTETRKNDTSNESKAPAVEWVRYT